MPSSKQRVTAFDTQILALYRDYEPTRNSAEQILEFVKTRYNVLRDLGVEYKDSSQIRSGTTALWQFLELMNAGTMYMFERVPTKEAFLFYEVLKGAMTEPEAGNAFHARVNAMIRFNTGRYLAEIGKHDEGIESCDQALERFIKSGMPDSEFYAHCWAVAARMGHWNEKSDQSMKTAIQILEKCRALGKDIELEFKLANAWRALHDTDTWGPYGHLVIYLDTIRIYRQQPEIADFYYDLGSALYEIGKLDMAFDYFKLSLKTALEFTPQHSSVAKRLESKARVHAQRGDYTEVIEHMHQAQDIWKNHFLAPKGLIEHYKLKCVLLNWLGRAAEAQEATNMAKQLEEEEKSREARS